MPNRENKEWGQAFDFAIPLEATYRLLTLGIEVFGLVLMVSKFLRKKETRKCVQDGGGCSLFCSHSVSQEWSRATDTPPMPFCVLSTNGMRDMAGSLLLGFFSLC